MYEVGEDNVDVWTHNTAETCRFPANDPAYHPALFTYSDNLCKVTYVIF